METDKYEYICPLLSIASLSKQVQLGQITKPYPCMKGACEWWDHRNEQCAVHKEPPWNKRKETKK